LAKGNEQSARHSHVKSRVSEDASAQIKNATSKGRTIDYIEVKNLAIMTKLKGRYQYGTVLASLLVKER
jgi:hypothetical protein